jgi:hypothetical protein
MRYATSWKQPRGLATTVFNGVKRRLDKIRPGHDAEHTDAEDAEEARATEHSDFAESVDDVTRLRRRARGSARSEEQATATFEGIELNLSNNDEGRQRVGLDFDLHLKLKDVRPVNDQGLGVEDETAEDEQGEPSGELEEDLESEEQDEAEEGAAAEEGSLPDDEEAAADDEQQELETGEEDDLDDEERDEAEARGEDDVLEDDEDEDFEAQERERDDEDFAASEREDLGAGEEKGSEEEDEELAARAREEEESEELGDSEEDEDSVALAAREEGAAGQEGEAEFGEDTGGSKHSTKEKRAALRSAGDGAAVSAGIERAPGRRNGAAGGVLRALSQKPELRPAVQTRADKVIAIAKQQVGVREGKNNYTKFAAELIKEKIAQRWWQNQPWCQTFQAWAFVESGLRKLAPMTPGCATAVSWFRTRKRLNQYPAVGAQVFFGPGGGQHVGLVYKYDPTHIWTIEGNTNDKGSAEGIGVFLKKRTRKSAFGYGYPKYPDGIVTADPRKKGTPGFTFKKAASSGAKDTASEPEREEQTLPWISVKQVQWAATNSMTAERAAKAGTANPRDDVKLVQQALEKIMKARSSDPEGIYEEDTERLFNRFRREKLKLTGAGASAKPGPKALSALGRQSQLFRVRVGSMAEVDDKAGPTTPARISARDVTFKRCTTPSTPEHRAEWIREACKKAGATPSSAWVKGYQTIIKRESGGNPNACNTWDSNAKTPPGFRKVKDYGDGYTKQGIVRLRGRPTHFQCSRGIVQCIPQTFAHHHARGTSRNIYDPVASIAASMRYVLSRYNVAKNGSNLARKVQQADPTRPPKGY